MFYLLRFRPFEIIHISATLLCFMLFTNKVSGQANTDFDAGMQAYKSGSYKEAVTDFSAAIDKNKKLYDAYYYRAYSNMYLHNWKPALKDLGKVKKQMKSNPGVYLAYGNIYNELGNYKNAIANFTNAIRLQPNLAEAYNNRGVSYQKMNNYRAAITDYGAAINADSSLATAFNNRGSAIYYNQDVAKAAKLDIETAIKDFSRALALDSNFCLARRNRALSYSFLKKNDLALADFNKAIKCDPSNSLNYLNRGTIKMRIHDDVHGIEDCIQALQMTPKLPEAYIEMSEGQLHLGYHQEAIRDLEKALAESKAYKPVVHYKIARINALDGNKAEMMKNLKMAEKEGYFKDKDSRSVFIGSPDFSNYQDDDEFMQLRDKIRKE